MILHDAELAAATLVLKSAANLQMAEKLGLFFLRNTPVKLAQSGINPWAKWHDNPQAPVQTFRQWYKENVGPLTTDKRIAPGQENAMRDCTSLPTEIGPMPIPRKSTKE